ncbi:AMP-binding protein [Nocardioides pacificus]
MTATTAPPPVEVLLAADPVQAFLDADRDGRDVVLATSGTSTQPRHVVRTTRSWTDSFPVVADLTGLAAESRVWVPGPVTASMNLFAAVHAAWAGAALVPALDEATHAQLTPTALRGLLFSSRAALAGVSVLVAGDSLDRATYDEAVAAGARVQHYYGAAELSFVAWGPHAGELRAFPGVEVEVRDGELWVRSPYLAKGYLEPGGRRPGAHRTNSRRAHFHRGSTGPLRTDADGWATVGDRGALVDDEFGGRVEVHGRAGGITTSGVTVQVSDIEQVLRGQASGQVVVVGTPHPELGEVVTAVLTRADDFATLRTVARAELSPGQQPRRWYHLERLPSSTAGKVDREALARLVVTPGAAQPLV